MENKPLFTRSYHIPLAMFDSAFLFFQRKHVYPRNIVLTVILLALAGVYVHAAVKTPENTLAYLLIIACIAIILITWYNTFKLRRAVHNALTEVESDTYELKVYQEKLVIRMEEAAKEAKALPDDAAEPETEPVPESGDTDGFRPIFPEKEAEPQEPIPPTEIPLDGNLRFYELDDFFMVYIVRQNFYVIPKKDLTDEETQTLRGLFRL